MFSHVLLELSKVLILASTFDKDEGRKRVFVVQHRSGFKPAILLYHSWLCTNNIQFSNSPNTLFCTLHQVTVDINGIICINQISLLLQFINTFPWNIWHDSPKNCFVLWWMTSLLDFNFLLIVRALQWVPLLFHLWHHRPQTTAWFC